MPITIESNNWTQAELDVCVKVYIKMLSKEKTGDSYKKSDYRDQVLAGALGQRTITSFECRMQSISHVLITLGMQYILAYTPAKNISENIFDLILISLARNGYALLTDLGTSVGIDNQKQ